MSSRGVVGRGGGVLRADDTSVGQRTARSASEHVRPRGEPLERRRSRRPACWPTIIWPEAIDEVRPLRKAAAENILGSTMLGECIETVARITSAWAARRLAARLVVAAPARVGQHDGADPAPGACVISWIAT